MVELNKSGEINHYFLIPITFGFAYALLSQIKDVIFFPCLNSLFLSSMKDGDLISYAYFSALVILLHE